MPSKQQMPEERGKNLESLAGGAKRASFSSGRRRSARLSEGNAVRLWENSDICMLEQASKQAAACQRPTNLLGMRHESREDANEEVRLWLPTRVISGLS